MRSMSEGTHPRPDFAKHYPPDPHLERALAAYVAGDFAKAGRCARALRAHEDPTIRASAIDLEGRTHPARLSVALLGLAVTIAIAVAAYWLVRGR